MVNLNLLVETAFHYLTMLFVIFLALSGLRATVGDLGFAIELGIVLLIAIAYRPVVRRLGIAPTAWENRST